MYYPTFRSILRPPVSQSQNSNFSQTKSYTRIWHSINYCSCIHVFHRYIVMERVCLIILILWGNSHGHPYDVSQYKNELMGGQSGLQEGWSLLFYSVLLSHRIAIFYVSLKLHALLLNICHTDCFLNFLENINHVCFSYCLLVNTATGSWTP